MIRFRPIMMTTMAALMGTFPIAIGLGSSSEGRKPLGLAVVGGLMLSQAVTLYITPVLYVYLDRLGRCFRPGVLRVRTGGVNRFRYSRLQRTLVLSCGTEMLKLYNFYASSTSYRTRIVLHCKGIAYEYVPVRLDRGEHLNAWYGEINPMRGVPTLEVDGVRLYQSPAIMEYLEEVYPAPAMLPKDPIGRAHVRALAAIVGSDMHPVTNLRIRNFVRDDYRQDADGCERLDPPLESARDSRRSKQCCARTKARDPGFCYGTTPTIADAYLVSHVFSAVRFKTDMSPYPLIRAVVENCDQLEPFAQAHPSRQPDAG